MIIQSVLLYLCLLWNPLYSNKWFIVMLRYNVVSTTSGAMNKHTVISYRPMHTLYTIVKMTTNLNF